MSKNSKVTKSKAGLADLTNAGGLADINRQILLRSADDVISPAIPIVFALKEATNWAGNTTCSCRYSLTFPTCIPVTFSSVVEGEAGRNAERIGLGVTAKHDEEELKMPQERLRRPCACMEDPRRRNSAARRNQRAESAILPLLGLADIPNVRIFQLNVRTMNDSLNADGITQCRG
ncbi:hypothetical protein ACO22_05221 [Paracoccidioides brasiliensis]|uniref:Uncharacterized protein n=1 Tax=Paracoccidioides brasiliensis TaxID=121759 RepID=A0A1D2JB22_PARBR|nr:hypothetical protein ACO22_05221 [Paracoccidioides brasiliensis]